MAPSESGIPVNSALPGGNITRLDDARKKRKSSKNGSTGQSDQSADSPPEEERRVSNRRFDKVKVERIKAEIANGDYEINYLQVADKFIEHERYG